MRCLQKQKNTINSPFKRILFIATSYIYTGEVYIYFLSILPNKPLHYKTKLYKYNMKVKNKSRVQKKSISFATLKEKNHKTAGAVLHTVYWIGIAVNSESSLLMVSAYVYVYKYI